MSFTNCRQPLYYDLVKIPHGHIPAPKVKFWSWLPIPIKGKRDSNTFQCPKCGRTNFFKILDRCETCKYEDSLTYDHEYDYEYSLHGPRYEKWRKRWKQLEYIFLPLLVLIGKASYLRSVRRHTTDYKRGLFN